MDFNENFGFDNKRSKKMSVNQRISTPLGDLRPSNDSRVNAQAHGGMELESNNTNSQNSWQKRATFGGGNNRLGPNFGVPQKEPNLKSNNFQNGMMEEERPNNLKVRMQERQSQRRDFSRKTESELKKEHDEIIDVILNKEE